MTTAQKQLTTETLEELKQLAPNVNWAVVWNYYTKLPQFTALKDGGVSFRMDKEERRETITQENGIKYTRYTGQKYVILSVCVDHTTKRSATGFIVSGAHNWNALPADTIRKEIPRINYKEYIKFIKDNLGILERIGA